MTHVISVFRTYFDRKIGRCAHCMRQASVASLSAWALFGAAVLMWPGSSAASLAGIAALALTALWLAHIAAHASRATVKAGRRLQVKTVDPAARRRVLGTFLRAAGIGLLASVPVISWSTAALAFCGQCTVNDDCGSGWSCKNTAAVNETVCNECVQD